MTVLPAAMMRSEMPTMTPTMFQVARRAAVRALGRVTGFLSIGLVVSLALAFLELRDLLVCLPNLRR